VPPPPGMGVPGIPGAPPPPGGVPPPPGMGVPNIPGAPPPPGMGVPNIPGAPPPPGMGVPGIPGAPPPPGGVPPPPGMGVPNIPGAPPGPPGFPGAPPPPPGMGVPGPPSTKSAQQNKKSSSDSTIRAYTKNKKLLDKRFERYWCYNALYNIHTTKQDDLKKIVEYEVVTLLKKIRLSLLLLNSDVIRQNQMNIQGSLDGLKWFENAPKIDDAVKHHQLFDLVLHMQHKKASCLRENSLDFLQGLLYCGPQDIRLVKLLYMTEVSFKNKFNAQTYNELRVLVFNIMKNNFSKVYHIYLKVLLSKAVRDEQNKIQDIIHDNSFIDNQLRVSITEFLQTLQNLLNQFFTADQMLMLNLNKYTPFIFSRYCRQPMRHYKDKQSNTNTRTNAHTFGCPNNYTKPLTLGNLESKNIKETLVVTKLPFYDKDVIKAVEDGNKGFKLMMIDSADRKTVNIQLVAFFHEHTSLHKLSTNDTNDEFIQNSANELITKINHFIPIYKLIFAPLLTEYNIYNTFCRLPVYFRNKNLTASSIKAYENIDFNKHDDTNNSNTNISNTIRLHTQLRRHFQTNTATNDVHLLIAQMSNQQTFQNIVKLHNQLKQLNMTYTIEKLIVYFEQYKHILYMYFKKADVQIILDVLINLNVIGKSQGFDDDFYNQLHKPVATTSTINESSSNQKTGKKSGKKTGKKTSKKTGKKSGKKKAQNTSNTKPQRVFVSRDRQLHTLAKDVTWSSSDNGPKLINEINQLKFTIQKNADTTQSSTPKKPKKKKKVRTKNDVLGARLINQVQWIAIKPKAMKDVKNSALFLKFFYIFANMMHSKSESQIENIINQQEDLMKQSFNTLKRYKYRPDIDDTEIQKGLFGRIKSAAIDPTNENNSLFHRDLLVLQIAKIFYNFEASSSSILKNLDVQAVLRLPLSKYYIQLLMHYNLRKKIATFTSEDAILYNKYRDFESDIRIAYKLNTSNQNVSDNNNTSEFQNKKFNFMIQEMQMQNETFNSLQNVFRITYSQITDLLDTLQFVKDLVFTMDQIKSNRLPQEQTSVVISYLSELKISKFNNPLMPPSFSFTEVAETYSNFNGCMLNDFYVPKPSQPQLKAGQAPYPSAEHRFNYKLKKLNYYLKKGSITYDEYLYRKHKLTHGTKK